MQLNLKKKEEEEEEKKKSFQTDQLTYQPGDWGLERGAAFLSTSFILYLSMPAFHYCHLFTAWPCTQDPLFIKHGLKRKKKDSVCIFVLLNSSQTYMKIKSILTANPESGLASLAPNSVIVI